MKISEMSLNDIVSVLPIYLDYYNNYENSCWTKETAKKRIQQVLKIEDSFSLIMKDENDCTIGFAMGYFKQYDDLIAYTLEEILISQKEQNKGLGSILLKELEKNVKEKGGAGIELQAVKDELHEKYYGKAGYFDANNFVLKCKWFK